MIFKCIMQNLIENNGIHYVLNLHSDLPSKAIIHEGNDTYEIYSI